MQEIKQSSQLIDQRNGLFSKDQVQITNKPEKKKINFLTIKKA